VLLGTIVSNVVSARWYQAATRVPKPNRTHVTPVSVFRLHSGLCNILHLAYSKPPAAQHVCGACRTPAAGRCMITNLYTNHWVSNHRYINLTGCSTSQNFQACTVGLHLPGLIPTARHPKMQKIRITGFLFENWLHWQSGVRLLLFTTCTCV